MKFKDDYRAELFGMARGLSPLLGDIFQNPMDVTFEDIDREIKAARIARQQEMDQFQRYLNQLGNAYCFPDQVEGIEYEQT